MESPNNIKINKTLHKQKLVSYDTKAFGLAIHTPAGTISKVSLSSRCCSVTIINYLITKRVSGIVCSLQTSSKRSCSRSLLQGLPFAASGCIDYDDVARQAMHDADSEAFFSQNRPITLGRTHAMSLSKGKQKKPPASGCHHALWGI
eukprot:6180657-Pleurochrysis_carterae.AAC.1